MANVTSEIPRDKLKELMERNGDSLLQDPDRCEGLLKDHCGAHRREISALVGALEERVPLELKSSWQTAMTPEAMRARLVQRLEENRGLAPEVAGWAVDAWSYALGVGLGRHSDRVEDGSLLAGGLTGGGGSGKPPADGNSGASIAERVASDRAGGASAGDGSGAKGSGLAQMSTPKKAGFGAAAALLLGVGAFALINNHHPTPPQPQPPQPAHTDPAPVDPTPKPKPDVPQGPSGHEEPPPPAPAPVRFLPSGTAVSVRLDHAINSDQVNIGDTVDATVSSPVTVDGNVIVSTGAKARLKITSVEHTTKEGGSDHLLLALVELSTEQGDVHVSAPARQFDGPTLRGEQVKHGAIGAGIGAVGGFVAGKLFHHGGAGAAAGAGAGGTVGVVTAKAQPVKIAAETPIHYRLSASVKAPGQTTAKK